MGDIFEFNSNERFYEDNYSNDDEPMDNGDDYYEDLKADDEDEEEEKEDVDDEDGEETRAHLSFACDDCDYRWDDIIIGNKDKIEREEFDLACPMCGSVAITQI